jgi:T5SS/PEP-CTERM-associated repeat protein
MKNDLLSRSPRHLSSSVLAALLLTQFGATCAFGQTLTIETDTTVSSTLFPTGVLIRDGAKLTIGTGGFVDSAGTSSIYNANVGGTATAAGNGILEISAGGKLANYIGFVGNAADTSGQATVTGAGSSWQSSNILYVGFNGSGSLTVAAGATVSGGINLTSDAIRVGYNAPGSGVVVVTGPGSSLTSSGTVVIGWNGTGSLSIADGAIVSGNIVQVGRFNTGSATVAGSGSVLRANAASGIIVGNDAGGTGVLTLTDGGTATSNNGASQMRLANNATATGTLNIGAPASAAADAPGIVNVSTINTPTGSGTVQFNTTSTSANPFFLTKDGTDTGDDVTISNLSQVVHTAGYTVLGGVNTNTGTTTVDGGTLIVNGSADFSDHTVNTGATLGGSGSVGSLSVAEGAFIAPGQSPGTLSVAGAATLAAGSNIVWEISDAAGMAGADWDLLSVGGTLTLEGTTADPITILLTSLDATFTPGLASNFNGQADATFTIASAAAIMGFDPSAFVVDASAFANAFAGDWSVALDQNQIVLAFVHSSQPPVFTVPDTWVRDAELGWLYGFENANWAYSQLIGFIEFSAFPWIYHAAAGWVYSAGRTADDSAIILYFNELGWAFASEGFPGQLYRVATGEFVEL